jgi:aspartate-semialdehyde dehydrogenase
MALPSSYVVGIVGATGAVGIEIIKCLQDRSFPVSRLHLYSSARSSGKIISTQLGDIIVEEYNLVNARLCHFLFLAVSGDFSLSNAILLSEGDGPIVIDNSSAFRYETEIPLVVSACNSVLSF